MGYYRGENHLVKYLVLYPQVNKIDIVTDLDGDVTSFTDTCERFDSKKVESLNSDTKDMKLLHFDSKETNSMKAKPIGWLR